MLYSRIGRLDYEVASSYDLLVQAYDYATGSPPNNYPGRITTDLHLLINLTDINDNFPQFSETTYSATLFENVAINTTVFTVKATDEDSDINGELLYDIQQTFPTNNSITYFIIDPDTGDIKLNSSLDLDFVQYPVTNIVLTVTATDKGSPSLYNSTSVTFTVEQVDEFTPQFIHGNISVSILENQSPSLVIFDGNATDSDYGLGGEFIYEKREGDGYLSLFSLDSDTGAVTAPVPFDRESKDSYSLVLAVETTPNNAIYRSATVNIQITILDENDNPPVFLQSLYRVEFVETTQVNSNVYQITATDRDINLNANLQYELKHEDSSGVFSIDSLTGAISLIVDLNLESPAVTLPTNETFNLTITAFDRSDNPLYASTTILMVVTGVNEFSPVFSTPDNQTLTVKENITLNSLILSVVATDGDFGPQGVVTYRIVSGNDDGKFSVSTDGGDINSIGELDRETVDTYQLVIGAIDSDPYISGRRESSISIEIRVEDVNDNKPILQQTTCSYSIPEDTLIGFNLFSVSATDSDINTNADIEFLIAINSRFSIDLLTGNVSLQSGVDFETVPSYTVYLSARDKGSPSLTSDVLQCSIAITGVNEFAPVFGNTLYSFSVSENSPVYTVIGSVTAGDSDAGVDGELTYAVVQGDTRFTVNNQGNVLVFGYLDREVDTLPITLNISAIDAPGGSLQFSAFTTVSIGVLDVNDNAPVFTINHQYKSIAENTPVNTSIAQYSATDVDQGTNSAILYSISIPGHFNIDPSSGVVSVGSELDRETNPTHSIEISAIDQAQQDRKTSVATLSVNIDDVNDNAPIFSSLHYLVVVEEDTLVSMVVLTVQASDLDTGTNGDVLYTIISQSADYFEIESSTGAISIVRTLSGADVVHNLTLGAVDRGDVALTSTATLSVHVTPTNKYAPQFVYSNNYTVYLEENRGYAYPIVNVTAEDSDLGSLGEVVYSLVGSYSFLYIHPSSGAITLLTPLDSEQYRDAILLQVQASDLATDEYRKTSLAYVLIIVMDVNDNSPFFSLQLYSVTIPTNQEIGQVISIVVSDRDSGVNSQLLYSVTGDSCPFYTDTLMGGVHYNGQILEAGREYNITLIAIDQGVPQLSGNTSVAITVLLSNKYAPIFLSPPNQLYVSEDMRINEKIHMFVAVDFDVGESAVIEYSISSGNIGDVFEISSDGEFYCRIQLDFEAVEQYSLIIEARNPSNLFEVRYSAISVKVLIRDVNDVAPEFMLNPYTFYFASNFKSGDQIGRLIITDDTLSTGSTLYRISSGDDFDIFSLSNNSLLSLAEDFDPDSHFITALEVEYYDGMFTATTTVNFIVEEPNIYSPVFLNESYTLRIKENTLFPSNVTQITVNDSDTGDNGQITFGISESSYFSIDQTSGVLSLIASLDYELFQTINLTITAEDNASPWQRKSAAISIYIQVINENDSPPLFTDTAYTFTIENNTNISSIIGSITATDKDTASTLFYQFTANNDFFDLNAQSGEISVKKELTIQGISLPVLVNDSIYQDTSLVIISVFPANLHSPVFEQQNYSKSVSEGTSIGSSILQPIASDLDNGNNGRIVYSISNTPYLIVNSTTGAIVLDQSLDAEQPPTEISLYITATDMAQPSLRKFTSVDVTIYVANDNDNFPVFSQSVYEIFVEEGTARDSLVCTVSAVDNDNEALAYQILSGNIDNAFSIDSSSGVLSLESVPYIDENPFYNLRIQASDPGQNTAIASFEIRIIPTNDYSPEFYLTNYSFVLTPSVTVGAFVGSISAVDLDTGNEGTVSYGIIAQSGTSFVLNPITGSLQLIAPVNSSLLSYSIAAQACDGAVVAYQLCTNISISIETQQMKLAYIIQPNSTSHTLQLPGINQISSFTAFQIIHNNSFVTLENLSLEPLTCFPNLELSLQLNYPFIEVIINTTGILNSLQTQLRIGIHSSSFSITTLILIPSITSTPEFQRSTYYTHIFSFHQVGAIVTTVSLDTVANNFETVLYEFSGGNEASIFAIKSDSGMIYLYKELQTNRPIYILSLVAKLFYNSGSPLFVESRTTLYIIVQDFVSSIVQSMLLPPNLNPIITFPSNVWSRNGSLEQSGNTYTMDMLSFTSKQDEIQVSIGHIGISFNTQVSSEVFYIYIPNNKVWSTRPVFKLIVYQDVFDGPLISNSSLILYIFSQPYISPFENGISYFTISIPSSEFDLLNGHDQLVEIPFVVNSNNGTITLSLSKVTQSSQSDFYISLPYDTLYYNEKFLLPIYAHYFQSEITTFEIKLDISGDLNFSSFTPAEGWTIFSQSNGISTVLYGVNDVILNSSVPTPSDSGLIGHFVLEHSGYHTNSLATLATELKLVTDSEGLVTDRNNYVDFLHINGLSRVASIQLLPDSPNTLISFILQKDILEISSTLLGVVSIIDLGISAIAISKTGIITHLNGENSQLKCSVDSNESIMFLESACNRLNFGNDTTPRRVAITVMYKDISHIQYVNVWGFQQISVNSDSDSLKPIYSWLNHNCEQMYEWTKLTILGIIVNMNSETRQIDLTNQLIAHLTYDPQVISLISFNPSFYLQPKNPTLEMMTVIITLDIQVESISMVPLFITYSNAYSYINGISSLLITDLSSSISINEDTLDVLTFTVSSNFTNKNRIGALQNSILIDSTTSLDYIFGSKYLHVIPVDPTKLFVVRNELPEIRSSLLFHSTYSYLLLVLSNSVACGGDLLYSTTSRVDIIQTAPSSVEIEIKHSRISHPNSLLALSGIPYLTQIKLIGIWPNHTQANISIGEVTVTQNNFSLNSIASSISFVINDPTMLLLPSLTSGTLSVRNESSTFGNITLSVYLNSVLSDSLLISVVHTPSMEIFAVSMYTGASLEFLPRIGSTLFEPFSIRAVLKAEDGYLINVTLDEYTIYSDSNSSLCASQDTCTLSSDAVSNFINISGRYRTIHSSTRLNLVTSPVVSSLNTVMLDSNGVTTGSVLYGLRNSSFSVSLTFSFVGLSGVYSLSSHNLSYFTESLTITSSQEAVIITASKNIILESECSSVLISILFFTSNTSHLLECNYLASPESPHLGNIVGTAIPTPIDSQYTVPLYFHFQQGSPFALDIEIEYNSTEMTFSHLTKTEEFSINSPSPYGDMFLLSSLTSSSIHIGALSNAANQSRLVKIADLSFILSPNQTSSPVISIQSNELFLLNSLTQKESSNLIGDLNGDSKLDMADILILSHSIAQQHLAEVTEGLNSIYDVTRDGAVDFEDFRRLFSAHFGILPLFLDYKLREGNKTNLCSFSIQVQLSNSQHSIYTNLDANSIKLYIGLIFSSDLSSYTDWSISIGSFLAPDYNGKTSVLLFEASPESVPSFYTLNTGKPLPKPLLTSRLFIFLESTQSLPFISSLFSVQTLDSHLEPISTDGISLVTPSGDPLPLPSTLHPLFTLSDLYQLDNCVISEPQYTATQLFLYIGTPTVFIIIILVLIFIILLMAVYFTRKNNKKTVQIHTTGSEEKENLQESIESESPLYRGLTYYPDPSETYSFARSPSPCKNMYENPHLVESGHFIPPIHDSKHDQIEDDLLQISHKISSKSAVHPLIQETLPGTPKKP